MTWLLGGSTAVGAVGMIVLAVYVAKFAKSSREDLLRLLGAQEALASTEEILQAHKHAMVGLNESLTEKENALEREREAREIAERALSAAEEQLAENAPSRGIVNSIRGTLDQLSKMSELPRATDKDSGESLALHGSATIDDKDIGG